MPTDKVELSLDSTGFERVLSSMRNFADQQVGLGSSGSDTSFLRFLGNALGVNPVSSARGAYQNSLSGMGLIANLRAGNPVQFDQLQPVDYGKRLINLVEELVKTNQKSGYDAARLYARQADIEDYLKITLLRPEHQTEYMEILRRQNREAGGPLGQAVAEFDFARAKFIDNLQQALTPLGTSFLNIGAKILRSFFNFDTGGMPAGGSAIGPGGGGLKANTQALNDLAQELRHTQGIFGGGRRARRAIPGAFGPGWGGFLPDALRSQTIRLGAYSVSM